MSVLVCVLTRSGYLVTWHPPVCADGDTGVCALRSSTSVLRGRKGGRAAAGQVLAHMMEVR